jgi:hypothetical protein
MSDSEPVPGDESEGGGPTRGSRWVARLTSLPGGTIETLLHLPLGLDVWHRQEDRLVVAASEAQLSEIERRRLARVERLATVSEYLERAQREPPLQAPEGGNPDGSDP